MNRSTSGDRLGFNTRAISAQLRLFQVHMVLSLQPCVHLCGYCIGVKNPGDAFHLEDFFFGVVCSISTEILPNLSQFFQMS